MLRITLPDGLHQRRHPLLDPGRDQHVDVVRHEHVGVDIALGGRRELPQQAEIEGSIEIVQEAGASIVSPLKDMGGDMGGAIAGMAGHVPATPTPRHSSTSNRGQTMFIARR